MDSSPQPTGPQDAPPLREGSTGLPPNIAAGLACIFLIVGGAVFLVLEKRSAYVRFYSMQSIFFGVAAFVISAAFEILKLLFHIVPGMSPLIGLAQWLFSLLVLAIYIIQIVKAFSGSEWEIPYLGPMARRQLGSPLI